MSTYIAFLRAINVGGRFAKMASVREGLADKGFGEVESYIQSGNLRFTSRLRSAQAVESAVESALAELCGFPVRTIVRTPVQLAELTSYGESLASPLGDARRYVTFLKSEPDDDLRTTMDGWDVPGERAHVHGREIYQWLTHPSHPAKLSNARIERKAMVATSRDWKVVSALGEMWAV